MQLAKTSTNENKLGRWFLDFKIPSTTEGHFRTSKNKKTNQQQPSEMSPNTIKKAAWLWCLEAEQESSHHHTMDT